ncbi:MAG: hypothetical protein QXS42_01100 [Zestosphaera sp.]
MRVRRSLGVEVELAEGLKAVARSRGMSLASYLKRLFEEVIEVERLDHYAPGVLEEKRVELVLSRLGFTYVPMELLDKDSSPEEAMRLGERAGRTLKELGIGLGGFIARAAANAGIAVVREDSVVLLPVSNSREVLRNLMVGMANGYGLKVVATGNLTIIKTK